MEKNFQQKYLKYKKKYHRLRQIGGFPPDEAPPSTPQELINFWTSPDLQNKRNRFIEYLLNEVSLPKKSGHYIWWVYPNIRELIGYSDQYTVELDTINQYQNIFNSPEYQLARSLIDQKHITWFIEPDKKRVKYMREVTNQMFPLDSLGTQPAAAAARPSTRRPPEYNPSRDIGKYQPAYSMHNTQSYYFMPIIAEAYLIASKIKVPQSILDMSGRIINTGIDQETYNQYVTSLVEYLQSGNNLNNLNDQFEIDRLPTQSDPGHITGTKQEELLDSIIVSNTPETGGLSILNILSAHIHSHNDLLATSSGPVVAASGQDDDATGLRFRSIDVLDNGNCFFYSLYQALTHHNLIDEFNKRFFNQLVRNENEFNTLLRRFLSQYLLSLISSNTEDYSINMVYDSYNKKEDAYNVYVQHPEDIPESSRIFPPAESRNKSKQDFIKYAAKKINTNKIFPNGILIGIVRSFFKNKFSDKKYELNASPNIEEFLPDGTKNTFKIKHTNPSQVQFIRDQDFKEKTVYIHNLKFNDHYHWIETPSIESPPLYHHHSGQQSQLDKLTVIWQN